MLLYLLFKLIVIDFNKVILKYIKIYYSSFFLHIYILKRNYTETYIFDTYIFGTDYTILWSVNVFFIMLH
jgi:ABC-type bacteriocin/lantibiotic exporter with double-glycine peptidase domain